MHKRGDLLLNEPVIGVLDTQRYAISLSPIGQLNESDNFFLFLPRQSINSNPNRARLEQTPPLDDDDVFRFPLFTFHTRTHT